MDAQAVALVAKQLADLRLQVNALQVISKESSLPVMLKQTRQTIMWSAIAIAVALILSSTIRLYSDDRVQDLLHRIEALEHATKHE